MRIERKIILGAVGLAIAMWIIDALVDYAFFHQRHFWQVMMGIDSWHEFYMRSVLVVSIALYAIIVTSFMGERTKRAVQYSEERFRSLVETTSDWIWEVDKDGIYTYASPRVKDFLGYEPWEIIGRKPFDLMPSDEADRVGYFFKKFVEAEMPFERLENVNVHKDGRRVVLETSGVPVFNAKGKVTGYRGIDRDITERKKAEEALKESEQMYRTLYESSRDAIMLLTPEKGFFSGNPATVNMFRCKSEDEFTSTTPAMLSPEYQPDGMTSMVKAQEMMDIAMKKGSHFFNWMHKRMDGSVFPATVLLTMMRYKDRQVLQATVRDITFQKKAEEALRESEERLRAIIDNTSAVIYLKDLNGRYMLINSRYEKLFNISKSEIVGKTDYNIFPKNMAQAFRSNDLDVLSAGMPIEFDEIAPHEDGPHDYISLKFPLCDRNGKPYAVCGISTDITERKRAAEQRAALEARLNQSQKMETVGMLAGGIAHDLNNILTPIFLHGELVMDDLPKESKARGHQERVMSAANNARDLVQRLLDFSRRKKSTEYISLRLSDVVLRTIDFLRSTLPSNVEIHHDIEGDCGTVLADPVQIQQVLMNLCANACSAMEEKGGIVRITMNSAEVDDDFIKAYPNARRGRHTMITVQDTGIGMDQKTMQRAFEPFFTTRKEGEGTGLGLFVANEIIEGYGGAITVESELGKGTSFHVYLPKHDEKA